MTAMIDISNTACQAAKNAADMAPRFTGYVACARVYIQPAGRLTAKSKRNLASFGWKVTPRAHNGTAIYLGYDNADGVLYGKAIAIAAAFTANGVSCYEDADMD